MSSVLRLFLSQNTALLSRSLTQTGPRTASAVARVAAAAAVQQPIRSLSATGALRCAEKLDTTAAAAAAPAATDAPNPLDRTRIVTLEQSLRYLASDAYRQTYGDQAVWEQYRRNHKGPFAPRRTRKTCVRKGAISTGNPCPICRDEYLLLDHRNLELLQQFISPHTGEVSFCQSASLSQTLSSDSALPFPTDPQLLEDRPVPAHPPAAAHRHRARPRPRPDHVRRAVPPVRLRRVLQRRAAAAGGNRRSGVHQLANTVSCSTTN